jgi:hypothetical protein
MRHAQRERWLQRCDQPQPGKIPEKFLQLISEITPAKKESC